MYTQKPWSLYEYLVISLTNAIVEITKNHNREARSKEAETQWR